MNKLVFYTCILLLVYGCANPADKNKGGETVGVESKKSSTETYAYHRFVGSFVGPFGYNKITLLISRIWSDSVQGRSIVGGNDRTFLGTIAPAEGGSVEITGREPGDHKDDGKFRILFRPDKPNELTGIWVPYDAKKDSKTFVLKRKQFKYRADVGIWPQASQRLLTEAEVENEVKSTLEMMRNEIFARHGYCFKKKHIRQQFEMENWYVPNTVDIKGFLTETEKNNIMLIKRYEKYAEEYGDAYGR